MKKEQGFALAGAANVFMGGFMPFEKAGHRSVSYSAMYNATVWSGRSYILRTIGY